MLRIRRAVGIRPRAARLQVAFLHDLDFARLVADADFRAGLAAAQQTIDSLRHIMMDRQFVDLDDLDDHIEGRRRLALQDRFLGAALLRFFIRERYRLNAADEIRERRVHQQVFEAVAVRRADELDAALGDCPRGERFRSTPISSMTMTSGIWFSTASIMTACWSEASAPASGALGRCRGAGYPRRRRSRSRYRR